MDWVRFQLKPRDERGAARTAAWIYLVSALVVTGSNFTIPVNGGSGSRFVALAVPVPLLLVGALLAWPKFRHAGPVLVLTPFFGVGVVVFLDLATMDASAGAQVAFFLPVLFAASQLRFLGAALTAAAAVLGDLVVAQQLIGSDVAALDVVDVALVVSLMTGLLVLGGRRQDSLVARLEGQAAEDPLTGLVTRRVLDEAVRRALNVPGVQAGTALILVDVDHFKAINDGYGHPVGDDALVHLAGLLARHARPDTVISRLGGDEMAVLIPGCSEAVARARAHEFLVTVRESPLRLPDGGLLPISISIGVAHAPSDQWRLRELYAAADASLYAAKRAGRGRVGGPSDDLADGPLEVADVSDGPLPGDLGLPGDDRLEHR